MDEIALRLKEERERLGLTQEAFAQCGKVSERAQQRYESGERIPDAQYLSCIGDIGVDVQYVIMGIRSGDAKLKPEEAALLDNYRHSSEDGQKAIEATSALLAQQGATKTGPSTKKKIA